MSHRMNPSVLSIAILLCMATGAVDAAAPTKGDLILPRSATLRLETSPGERTAPRWADELGIGWPATVSAVNGQWLQISDEGGYTLHGTTPKTGWVRKDEVRNVNEEATLAAYTGEIMTAARSTPRNTASLARLYWLRGVCRETDTPNRPSEPRIALVDHQKATRLDATVADAWLRQGRLLAMLDTVGAQTHWEGCFRMAHDRFVCIDASRMKRSATSARQKISGRAPNMSMPALNNGAPEQLPTPRPDNLPPSGWSLLVPPQLYFDMGRAYKALCEARWNATTANSEASAARAEAVSARIEANAARAESATAKSRASVAKAEAVEARARVDVARAEVNLANAQERRGKGAIATAQAKLKTAEAKRKAADAEVLAKLADAAAARAANSVAWAHAIANRADKVAASAEAFADRYEAGAETSEDDDECFDCARRCFQAATCSNPSWFRPPSAMGDLFRGIVEKSLDFDGEDDTPTNDVPTGDLFKAIRYYNEAIRLNDQFDEALRGRAEALRWLAISDLEPPATPPLDPTFDGLFSTDAAVSEAAQRRVLDMAHQSAEAASTVKYDRDPNSLVVLGRIQVDQAYAIGSNVSIQYLAQAGETLRNAHLYSKSIADRSKLNDLVVDVETQSLLALANLDAQSETRFLSVWRKAAGMKGGVDGLWAKLQSLDLDDFRRMIDDSRFTEFVEAVATARAAISEIDLIRPFPSEDDVKAKPSTMRSAIPIYRNEQWPLAPLGRSDLVNRIARTRAWESALELLQDQACDLAADFTCPLHDELTECVGEWDACD